MASQPNALLDVLPFPWQVCATNGMVRVCEGTAETPATATLKATSKAGRAASLELRFRAGLDRRHRLPEVMEQPDLDRKVHIRALRGLARVNRWTGRSGILWQYIAPLARAAQPRPLRVLDIATGAGDVPIGLWRKARRAGLALQADGCDLNPCALQFARQCADEQQAAVRFFSLDALNDTLPAGYDVVMTSLFLHHLEDDQAAGLLRRMGRAAKRLVLVNDLARNLPCYLSIAFICRLLSASPVVNIDGPRSVEAAFTPAELRTLARRAGLARASVFRRYPCRVLLLWRPHD